MTESVPLTLDAKKRRKEAVNSQTQELHALEARLRDTEERLKERQSKDPSSADRIGPTNLPNRRQPLGETLNGQDNNRLESSTTTPEAKQAPASQSVSASTMSRWRPAQNTASEKGGEHADNAALSRPSRQENIRYAK